MTNMTDKFPPIHTGEILLVEFLEPMGISQYRLAKDINVPPRRINEIVLGKRAITPVPPCGYLYTLDFLNGFG
jgi:plasmid maintenance system antidote protein VapI